MKRKLNLALWIAAGILAVAFLVAGSTKLFVPKEKLADIGGAASRWVEDFTPGALRAIAAVELLAAFGLIAPAALGIAPVLVPLAATGAFLLFCRRGDHAPAQWREGNDNRRPSRSRLGRIRNVGPQVETFYRPRACLSKKSVIGESNSL